MTLEEIEESPSRQYFVRNFGSVEKARTRENECRLTTCAFLQESGQKLRLPQLSIATAIVFYHRFYARESYENYERFQVATTCLFLASKVEETPRKLRDVIVESYKVQHNTVQPPENDQEFFRLKEQVLICERELLRVLGFDLAVEHAYRPLLAYVKSISGPRDLAQIAWNFINDSLRTTICLQYAPRCVAAAAAVMASEYLESKQRPFPLPPHPKGTDGKWHHAFQVRESTVRTIVDQIKRMYDDNKGQGPMLSSNDRVKSSTASNAPAADASADNKPSAGGSGRAGESVKREGGSVRGTAASSSAASGGRRDEPSVKRESSREESGVKRDKEAAVKEEGEVEEDDVPPTKRPKEAEG